MISMNQALMQQGMYDRLRQCRDTMALNGVPGWSHSKIENLAAVFVPVRLWPEARVPFTVLVVGQATHGYGPDEACLETFEKTTARNVELATGYLLKPRSVFWRWTRAVLAEVYNQLGHVQATDEQLIGCLGWSNLAKIGDTKGNPPAWTVQGQAALAVDALQDEVARMQPTIVIACVGAFGLGRGRPIFEGAFGPNSWDGASLGEGLISGTPVIFAQHPRTLVSTGQWDSTIGAVSNRIAVAARRAA